MKTLVLGMGNELLSDDGVGIQVARRLRQVVLDPEVEVRETGLAGLELIDILAGFDRAIIVDSIATGAQPGTVHVLSLADLDTGVPPSTLHHVDLPTVLELARRLGIRMPDDVRVLAVEAKDVSTFGGGCCAEVEAAATRVVDTIAQNLLAASAPSW